MRIQIYLKAAHLSNCPLYFLKAKLTMSHAVPLAHTEFEAGCGHLSGAFSMVELES